MASLLNLQRHRNSIDYEALQRAHPAAPDYFETAYVLEPDKIEWMQEQRLKSELDRATTIPFYQRLWERNGFDHRKIKHLSQLNEIPMYTVTELRESLEEIAPPYGDFQSVSLKAHAQHMPLRVFFSGGTTGKPRPTVYTKWDFEVFSLLAARAFYMAGLRPGDVVLNSWAYSTHITGLLVDNALLNWLSCVPISTSTGLVTPSRKQLELAQDFGAASIIAIGDYILSLARTATEMGLDPKKDFAFKTFTGGVSSEIERAWGVPSYDSYGTHDVTWVSAECPEHGGLHIFEDACLIQIVDVDTGEPVPDGEPGNIVMTSFHKTGTAQVRFNTLDMSRLFPRSQCACGSWLRKMDYFGGRSDNMVKLRGINVWPESVGRLVMADPRTETEYFVEASGELGREELRVYVETSIAESERPDLVRELERQLKETFEVRIPVHAVNPGELTERTGLGSSPKPTRFKDLRGRFAGRG